MLSVGVIVVIAMVMLTIGSFSAEVKEKVEKFVAMDMPPAPGEKPETEHEVAKSSEQFAAVPRPPVPDPQPVREPAFNYIHLTSQEMAAADIAKMPRRSADAEGGAEAGSGDDGGVGTGPGGQRLYRAKWYREPTHAEMSGYMPRNGRGGDWGMIACRTIEHYHVEDCQELGESPPGSGMARALRQASWQFLVYPPRLGGKTLVGAWVSIRFEFSHEAAASILPGASDQP